MYTRPKTFMTAVVAVLIAVLGLLPGSAFAQQTIDSRIGKLSFTKNFENSEFVVLMELVDHQTTPYKRGAVQPIYPADGDVKKAYR